MLLSLLLFLLLFFSITQVVKNSKKKPLKINHLFKIAKSSWLTVNF